jgi:MtaA/CmuA family methyltransferase
MNSRERILAMFDGRPVDHLPNMAITMMFAADQIGAKYLDYATHYRVLAEGQLRTSERFGIDHVSVISDPAIEAADCGAEARFYPDQPPAIDEANALLANKTRLLSLTSLLANFERGEFGRRMTNRIQGVSLLKERSGGEKLVEGWVEGPCAEGSDLRGINNLMLDFIDEPAFVRDLFEFIVAMGLAFVKAQVAAGADLIGIGDAAASLVGPRIYREFVWPYEKRLVDGIHALGARVRLHICGNTRRILDGMGRLGCDMIDLDYLAPVGEGRAELGPQQVLLGNIDPVRVLRDGTPDSVYKAIGVCHQQAGNRYIVGAGCEVPRDTPPENLLALASYAGAH